ncbi:hypothetical protein LTR37_017666 [Vermiconidia calcicola]|uniref:Uncharacterized protein n=1 Tax=Vermiconidia calcicola TaxID=1690605 RepID=A0ACC3MJG9_9PEZI|nr:hypothetical protein LTR37_017666 [Vermiconidia calcicola]
MADLLPTLLSFPPEKEVSNKEYDKQATKYVESLNKISESAWTKPVNKQNILDLLNPATNSIPYLYALYAQWRNASKDRTRNEDAMTRAFIFFTSFDPVQVRYAGDTWLRLLDQAIDITPKLGVTDFTPITTAMLRLDPTAGTFTSLHLRLVRMCLAEGAPSQALPILDKNIYAFPQAPHKNLPDELLCEDHELSNSFITTKTGFSITPLKSEWILEYYLLGADIYIGLRNYSRARLFLEYLLLTPTSQHSCSALQTEAYKKWTLLGLLAQGKSFPLPRTHNQQVMKSMKAIGKPYDALAESFEKRQWRKFQAEMEAGFQIWQEDGNLRLVREVADALMRYRVLDLQNTYAALTVGRVASHLSLSADETFTILTAMREQGYLHARITAFSNDSASDTAVLHFHPTTESADEDSLQNQTTRIESLITFLRDADRRLQLTKDYIEVQKRGKRGGAGPDGDLAEQMDLTWDDAPIAGMGDGEGDEDIMAG